MHVVKALLNFYAKLQETPTFASNNPEVIIPSLLDMSGVLILPIPSSSIIVRHYEKNQGSPLWMLDDC